jgi:NAD(P)-dependent dehydrogenase (short-subunit alcohol dehydrogenase family)
MSERKFGFENTTEQVSEGIDLTGRHALVTGASSGLGAETARALALRGASVTLACRNLETGREIAEQIQSSTGNDAIDVMALDLTSPDQIRSFAKAFAAAHPQLSLLVNNAGVMACPLGRTERGWEMQFGTNHMGHFLMTCLLVPQLKAGAPSRVVNLSSAGHRFSDVLWDDPNYETRDYDKWESYGQSKTANVLFSVELNRRLAGQGIEAFAVHPGGIMTNLGRHLEQADIEELMSRAPGGQGIKWKTVEQGAATSVWAATAPELEGRGGIYLEDCSVAVPKTSDEQDGGIADYAVDPESAKRLWAMSEELLGESFPLA